MRLLLLGDLHYSSISSSSRLDSIEDEFIFRFKDLKEKIKKYNIDAIVCTGDIFNSPYQKPATIISLATEINNLAVPFITAIGNHDEIGYRLEGWKDTTSLGLLCRLSPNIITETITHCKDTDDVVMFSMQHFTPTVDSKNDEGIYEGYYPKESKEDTFCLHMVHGYMVDGILPFPVVNPTDIADTPANFILAGHYHQPVFKKIGDKIFYNPGSFANLTYDDKDRICEVGLLDTQTNEFERLPVPYKKSEWVIKIDTKFKKQDLVLAETIYTTDTLALIKDVAKTKEIQEATTQRYWEVQDE